MIKAERTKLTLKRVAALLTLSAFGISGVVHLYVLLGAFRSRAVDSNFHLGGSILGGDYPAFYTAGRLALKHQTDLIWNPVAFHASLSQFFGPIVAKLPFLNPPPSLFLWEPLSRLNYLESFSV